MWFLSELILLTILIYTNGYDKKCPHSSQWNFISRSYECLGQQIYMCLLDNLQSNDKHLVYKPYCGLGDVTREGHRYIFSPNLDEAPCAASRYQPFTFTTDGNSQCVLSKSLCKGSGQILANNGSSFTDTSCRCDYRQNFDYIIPPKDPCSCQPTEEDCSCYIRKCDDDKFMLADYRCMKRVETILPEDIKCPIINRIVPPEETDAVAKNMFQTVIISRTWSKQASVSLIVIVIIYTVLIGFLLFSVPHINSIILKSKFAVKRKENEFMILNGDNVKIECNVKSYIPVRSVTWQKEIDGEIIEIIASEDKYKMDCGKRPSLTIDNFNTGDHGKYRCIVRNAIGLRNGICGSCMHSMSRFDWLTGFLSVLQHIPAFHTEDITLHTYDIDSQSTPTVYNVYEGDDITLEHHIYGQQKLKTVKWFNESDKGTELDMSSDQYNGGVPEVPSLTIKNTTIGNAGKYFCLLIYDNGKAQKALFKLKILPQVKIYKALCEHREDKTFICPAIFETIDKQMQDNNIVIITGREGTGKSKICLELASIYDDKDYMVLTVDLSENYTMYTDIGNALLIIDDQQYTQDSLITFLKHLLPVMLERNIKVILSCRYLDLEIVSSVSEIIPLKGEPFIDINSCLTPEEKEEMLRRYIQENNIAISTANVSNLGNQEIITDLSLQITLADDTIKVIRNEEPWKGFPLCASLFCSERKFLHLGEKYFTNPPKNLVEELKKLYEAARKTSNCKDKINEFCILVYIMSNKNHQLDLNEPDLCKNLVELYQTLFQFKYIPDKPGSNDDQKIAIEEAVHRMNNKYLKFHDHVYEFINPCLLKAIFLSSESMVPYLLENGSLHDLTEFVRSEVYAALENELVVNIHEDYHQILCERLVRHAFENHSLLLHVAQYIYSYWRSSGTTLMNKMFKHIEWLLFNNLEVHIGDSLSLDNESLSENRINLEGVKFSKIIMLLDELTYKGRDSWIYGPGTEDFLILSGLVTAAMGRYATNRDETFNVLLTEFQERKHSETFVKIWSTPLDINGNTFFHYLMGLSQKEASKIISVTAERKFIFNTENVKKYTPLDIAAFLGKIDIFKTLNLKTSDCSNKLRKRLKRLAKSGKNENFNENFKNKNIDQSVIDQTKDDGASPAKLEHEGADDEKKKVVDENNENINKNSRKLIHRKEESNEKENHDKRDVLCFEDVMLNVVVNGEEDEYQSIIKLFSKHLINYGIVKKYTA